MNGFLINVFDKGKIYPKGGYLPSPIIYKGHCHIDPPIIPPYCYGDHPENKTGLKSLKPEDALIFHSTLVDDETNVPNRYIIGGFVVGKVAQLNDLTTQERKKYHLNPHIVYNDNTATLYYNTKPLFSNDVIAAPNSPFLIEPVLFTMQLAEVLNLKIKWDAKFTPYQQIAWSTRAVRKIPLLQIHFILDEARRQHGKSKN